MEAVEIGVIIACELKLEHDGWCTMGRFDPQTWLDRIAANEICGKQYGEPVNLPESLWACGGEINHDGDCSMMKWETHSWKQNNERKFLCGKIGNQRDFEKSPNIRLPAQSVDHPAHYGGGDNPYETIKVIENWDLGFHLGNAVKYISRAGKKGDRQEDLKKALWYLQRELENHGCVDR
jgi:hypothetical protein